MARWKVLIGSRSFGKAVPDHVTRLVDAGCEVIPNAMGRAYRASELIEALPGIDAIITGTDEPPPMSSNPRIGYGLSLSMALEPTTSTRRHEREASSSRRLQERSMTPLLTSRWPCFLLWHAKSSRPT